MSIETPAKRQRTGDASADVTRRPPPKALSPEQRHTILHAQYLENGISALHRLEALRSGNSDLGQVAWSPQNVLAVASNTRRSSAASPLPIPSSGGHVVVQYPLASSSRPRLKPSCLYPDQPTFSSSSTAGPSQTRNAGTATNTQAQPPSYDDPIHISFSPCGYYLCAFFPLLRRPSTTPLRLDASQPPSGSAPLASTSLDAATLPTGAPAIPQLSSSNVPSLTQTLPLAQDPASILPSQPPTERPRARFCIWSRAETGALNDWKLVQSIPCESAPSTGHLALATKTDNVLKVNDKGQPIASDGRQPSPSDLASTSILRGGIKQVVWLNRRRRIVLGSPSSSASHYGASCFSRLAARGPSFVPTASASADDAGPDQDVALVVFGNHGQVTLLSSRKSDRAAASNAINGSIGDTSTAGNAPPTFFGTMLQSSLYTASLQPSPVTLDSAHNLGGHSDANAARYISPFSATRSENHASDFGQEHAAEDILTHLAVGMPANDNVLLVASKRPTSSTSCVDLTEITVDLRAESITMITRPLQSATLCSTQHARSSDSFENGAASSDVASAPVDLDHTSILTWAEVGSSSSNQDGDTAKSASLRLVACASHLQAPPINAESTDRDAPTSVMRSTIAVWDLVKAENELSDAFTSLECRKTGHVPKWLNWQLRFAQSKTLTNHIITSLVVDAPGTAVADVALLTTLTPARRDSGLLSEQVGFFDLKNVSMVEGQLSAVPAQALSRSSNPVISSNGALFAMLSSRHDGAADKGLVLCKTPTYPQRPSTQNVNGAAGQAQAREEEARMSQLLALSCLRKTDASDVGRAFASSALQESAGKLLVEVGDLLRITESKRQDVLVKIEGATQKGPSHDSNSIPFHQALRLLKIRMAMGDGKASSKPTARLERLVLELGLCYQVLRLARVTTEVVVNATPPVAESGKKKSSGGAAKAAAAAAAAAPIGAGETRQRVYYRLESVWPLLAQLQWFLALLDGISKLALATSASDDTSKAAADPSSTAHADQDSFEIDFVRMLNKPTPRRLVLQILAHFCDFQEWISSTSKKDNLPPASGVDSSDVTAFFASPEPSSDGRVLAVSEQMALARDALHRVIGQASIDLAGFAQLLVEIEAESTVTGAGGSVSSQSRETDRFWWATLDGSKVDLVDGASNTKAEQDSAVSLQSKLLSSIVDPQSGVLVDVLTLFVSPEDVSDEHKVLHEKGALGEQVFDVVDKDSAFMKALSAMSAKRSHAGKRRDIVRKVSLHHAVTQNSLLNDASTVLRTHPTTIIPATPAQRLQAASMTGNEAEAESNLIRVSVMRAKRCVRCHAVSQDPVTASYHMPPNTSPANPAALVVDPNLPAQVQMQLQMQMQMQMQMMQMQMQMQLQQQQQQPQQGATMPAMQPAAAAFVPMLQPQPKLVSIEVGPGSTRMDRFRFGCVCGGAWWVL